MVIGRLRAGASVASASAEAANVHRATADSGPRHLHEASIIAAPIRFGVSAEEPVENTIARWMAAVSAMILLIAFANVVNLILARLARRSRDLAIRIALGSGRARVARLLVLEGALLALAGAAAALLIAHVTEPIVRHALFGDDASWRFTLLDLRVLGIVLVVTSLTGIFAGIAPALLHAADARFTAALKSGAQNAGSRSRLRSALTVAQAALSVVLLVGAGLFIRSTMNVRAIDLGVQPDQVIVATATLPRPETLFGTDWFEGGLAAERDTYLRLLEQVRAIPGVERASVALGLPLDGGAFSTGVWVDDRDAVARAYGSAYIAAVADDYFETVGTRLLRGRAFTKDDRESTEPVVVIGITMARTLFPDREALGACVRLGGETVPCSRVVGIVADVRRTGLRSDPTMQFYIPFGQHRGFMGANLLVRPTSAAELPMARLRKVILDAEPTVGAVDLQPLGAWLEGELRPLRLGMVTFGLSAALALLVAALGLYSLMTYMVAWRTREIGIRAAIGATDAQIVRLIITSGAGLAGVGILIGLGFSVLGARWLQPQLFHTSARDPLVLAIVAISLMMVALLAGWMPARRALRISPTEALRAE
jgi:predicted permease